jgi:protein-disulfide isomerase
MTKLSLPFARPLLVAAGVSLVLGLAACKKSEGTAASSGPVAAVAPPAGKAWSDIVNKTADGAGVVMGNPNAPVKIVEYGSLSCPHCAKLAQDGMAPSPAPMWPAARFRMNSAALPSTRRIFRSPCW